MYSYENSLGKICIFIDTNVQLIDFDSVALSIEQLCGLPYRIYCLY